MSEEKLDNNKEIKREGEVKNGNSSSPVPSSPSLLNVKLKKVIVECKKCKKPMERLTNIENLWFIKRNLLPPNFVCRSCKIGHWCEDSCFEEHNK